MTAPKGAATLGLAHDERTRSRRVPRIGSTMDQDFQIGDYAETYRTFRMEVPERFNWAYEVFDRWGQDPEKVAMVWASQDGQSRDVTFREFSDRSRRAANALAGLGAEPGDHIFIMLPRLVEWWEIVLGCIRARLISVPGTTLLTPRDIAYRINAAEIKIVVTDLENINKIESIRQECPTLQEVVVLGDSGSQLEYEALLSKASPDLPHPNNLSSDPMMLYFTSGTTGYPKGVSVTHANYPIGHVTTGKFWMDNRPSDLHWTLSDTGWAQVAWTHFFGPWNMGAAIFVWDQRGKFDPMGTLRMLESFPITTFFAPPTAYRMLVLEDLGSVRPKALRYSIGAGGATEPRGHRRMAPGNGPSHLGGLRADGDHSLRGHVSRHGLQAGLHGRGRAWLPCGRRRRGRDRASPRGKRARSPSGYTPTARWDCSPGIGGTPRPTRWYFAMTGITQATERRATRTAISGSWAVPTT